MCAGVILLSRGEIMKRPKYPILALLWLLLIPAQLIIDFILVSIAAYGDVSMADPNAYGHPAPAITIFASLTAVAFTIIVVIISIVLVIVRYIILNKRYNEYKKQFNRISQ